MDTSNGTCEQSSLWICCTQFDNIAFFAYYCIFGTKYMVQWLLISFTTVATAYYSSLPRSLTHTKNCMASTVISFSFRICFDFFHNKFVWDKNHCLTYVFWFLDLVWRELTHVQFFSFKYHTKQKLISFGFGGGKFWIC